MSSLVTRALRMAWRKAQCLVPEPNRDNELVILRSRDGQEIALCGFCNQLIDRVLERPNGSYVPHQGRLAKLEESTLRGCCLCQVLVGVLRSELIRATWKNSRHLAKGADVYFDVTPKGNCLECRAYYWVPGGTSGCWVNFQCFTESEDPLSIIVPERPLSYDTRSDDCLGTCVKWISQCRAEHHLCSWPSQQTLPSRVIDVGILPFDRDPFLFVTEGAKGHWMTLSHCWGGLIPVTTSLSTLAARQRGLPLEELPATFQDAILLTRRLGFRYLWIDSLCIIQDSPEDWALEAAKMHEIYAKASLNIAASAAYNVHDGIFQSSNRTQHLKLALASIPIRYAGSKVLGSLSIRYHPRSSSTPVPQIPSEPLHSRAWVMQESILSPRRLEFASSQLSWNCRTCSLFESEPNESAFREPAELAIGSLFPMLGRTYEPYPDLGSLAMADISPVAWWYNILEVYMQRDITFNEDRLPAISALAKEMSERVDWHYIAGLWLEDLPRGLLWWYDSAIRTQKPSTRPSWSWATLDRASGRSLISLLEYYLPDHRVTVIDAHVVNEKGNVFGRAISGKLTLRGYVRALGYWQEPLNPVYKSDRCGRNLTARDVENHSGRVECWLDEGCDENEEHQQMIARKAVCLQIGKWQHYFQCDWTTIYALILEPTGRSSGEYRRIGIADIPEMDGMADGWDLSTVTVI